MVAGGHQVEILDRDPAEAQQLAKDLGGAATALDPGARFGGQVVVLAVYDPGVNDAVQQDVASDGGLRPVDVGPLSRAQQLEQLGFLHISLQQPLDLGFGSAVKFVMP